VYQLIYVDPPWTYRDPAASGARGAGFKYSLMTIDQLMAMRPFIDSIAAPNCLLAMWWVGPLPHDALKLVDAWGFKLKTMKGFCWRKLTRGGKEHFGMGNWSRANTEDCLFAVRGRPVRRHRGVRQIINSQIRKHSQKPDETRDRLVQLLGNVPRVELFARVAAPGWDVWGSELDTVQWRLKATWMRSLVQIIA
jgi:N6-adenosine-specific RNA methylase IME4